MQNNDSSLRGGKVYLVSFDEQQRQILLNALRIAIDTKTFGASDPTGEECKILFSMISQVLVGYTTAEKLNIERPEQIVINSLCF